jgi:hypothetical protein
VRDFIENVVSAGTTYTSGSTVESGISDAKFSPTLAKWELNVSAISEGVYIVPSPTLILDIVLWLEALREFNSLISFQVDFEFFLLASRLTLKF